MQPVRSGGAGWWRGGKGVVKGQYRGGGGAGREGGMVDGNWSYSLFDDEWDLDYSFFLTDYFPSPP